ncbi:MAG: DUF4390 domain-containing protein [Pseudomonadota bacterium]|nr:DUF4390 domain-containing protein [Pseudomonadota bacterium]MDP1905315.1 DUF4390 domain-containing protein [Pseudomonadota bacterium]MDP2353867.1 DUF4390 domain-containing protein [Pseudomonadota bacterium]
MLVCTRRKFLRAALATLVMAALGMPGAHAEGVQAQQIDVVQRGELFHLNGGFAIQLSPTLDDALRRGVQLTFVQAVEAERARDWWLAEGLSDLERSVRLSYNALLRQYYVTLSGVSSAHENLADALRAAGDLRDWAVVSVKQMKKRSEYKIYVRMYLDVSQLPKPLQVNALASSGRWQLDSGWLERTFKY